MSHVRLPLDAFTRRTGARRFTTRAESGQYTSGPAADAYAARAAVEREERSHWRHRSTLGAGPRERKSDLKPYAVLDTETDGLRGALVWWEVTCEHGERQSGSDAGALWILVTSGNTHGHSWRDHVWWAHNGGGYDYLYLLPAARQAVAEESVRVTPITRQDAVIGWRVQWSKHRVDLRDSFALLPSSLRELAASFAPELPKLDIGLADGERFDPANATHRAYAQRDVDALLAVLVRFRAILAERFGVAPSWSLASTALRAWRATLGDAAYVIPPAAAAAFARAGYFGGMVRIASTLTHDDCVTLDVNSMYPSVMRSAGVPDGAVAYVRREVAGRPAFYRVTVTTAPGDPWTLLPYRDRTGALAWPRGTFETIITSDELAVARSRGATVMVCDGWVWSRLAYPFRAYVDAVERLRAEGGAFAAVGKLMGNGLYGKFGSRPAHDDWRLSGERPGPDWWPPAYDASDVDAAASHAGLWVRRDVPLQADYLMPHWAAWITAHARLTLAGYAARAGAGAVLYADTDSVTLPAAAAALLAADIGPAFGQLKVETRWAWFRAVAPKVYEGLRDDGTLIRKAKGIPRRDSDRPAYDPLAAAFAGETVTWASPAGSLAVLQGAAMIGPRTRSLSVLANSPAWRECDDGSVVPITIVPPLTAWAMLPP